MQRTRLNANIEFEEAAASRLELEFYYEGAGWFRPTKKSDSPDQRFLAFLHAARNAQATTQCTLSAVEFRFARIRVRAFAKTSPDTRTY